MRDEEKYILYGFEGGQLEWAMALSSSSFVIEFAKVKIFLRSRQDLQNYWFLNLSTYSKKSIQSQSSIPMISFLRVFMIPIATSTGARSFFDTMKSQTLLANSRGKLQKKRVRNHWKIHSSSMMPIFFSFSKILGSFLSRRAQKTEQQNLASGNPSSQRPMARMRSCASIRTSRVKHYYSSHPESSRNPAMKFRPCVYPICGKQRATFFKIFQNLSRLCLQPKKDDSGQVLVVSLAICWKQGWAVLCSSVHALRAGRGTPCVMVSSCSHMTLSFSEMFQRER